MYYDFIQLKIVYNWLLVFKINRFENKKNHVLKSVGRFMFKTTWSSGCFVDVILHVSSSTQQDWVIFITETSDSDTIIKNGLLKAEITVESLDPYYVSNTKNCGLHYQNCLDCMAISFHRHAFSCRWHRQTRHRYCNITGILCFLSIHTQTWVDNHETWRPHQ